MLLSSGVLIESAGDAAAETAAGARLASEVAADLQGDCLLLRQAAALETTFIQPVLAPISGAAVSRGSRRDAIMHGR